MKITEEQRRQAVPCQFCTGKVAPIRDAQGKPAGILHSNPTCPMFNRLTPEDFVAASTAFADAGLRLVAGPR